eukprot:CAMPEP_0196803210 /NCGR_PEP_ID=MMETSP1362-20130617/2594_1 /TAXON_ID=163516 /ORGANISM="Leptocylindrus danicus, Strain CCMP1856" /LENGTH=207 /DNA_ID=CAMNT_0042174663 /DNA_START=233 /DNA_END=854 /DNA_ORIENTATION=-
MAPCYVALASSRAHAALLSSKSFTATISSKIVTRYEYPYLSNSATRLFSSIEGNDNASGERKSVTGPIYTADDSSTPMVTLFTKDGCTLCDKVKDVLESLKNSNGEAYSHSLQAIDITDEEHKETWYSKYKYDIPVLHMDGEYWIKHRLTEDEAIKGFQAVKEGTFSSPPGEPDAGEMERRQAARASNTICSTGNPKDNYAGNPKDN